MKVQFASFISLLALSGVIGEELSCDEENGWVKVGGVCLISSTKFPEFDQKLSWMDGRRRCSKFAYELNANVTLGLIENKEIYDEMDSYFEVGKTDVWVGCSDLRVTKDYVWEDMTPHKSKYNYWLPGQPNNYAGMQDCVEIEIKSRKYNDEVCGNKQHYFCTYPL